MDMSKNSSSKKILKIGITGGIGSGKTTICKIFETLGIPVYYADDRAKWLMVNNLDLVSKLKSLFGKEAYLENGELNRKYISSKVFSDISLLEKLNSIVHPAVFKDGIQWHDSFKDVSYTLKEAALLFESGGYKNLDKVITVYAPKEVRIQRVMNRDGSSRAEVEARIDKQMPDAEKMELADYIIKNDERNKLIQQVLEIHQKILDL